MVNRAARDTLVHLGASTARGAGDTKAADGAAKQSARHKRIIVRSGAALSGVAVRIRRRRSKSKFER
jgi:hypothetical protein